MKPKSRVLNIIGTLMIVFGAIYLIMPSSPGRPPKDAVDYGIALWLIATGIGLVQHKVWSFWLFVIVGVIGVVATFVNSLAASTSIGAALTYAGIIALLVAVPGLLIWARRDRLTAFRRENVDA